MDNDTRHQYCLKWNNHKNNISGVFDRLRTDERFVDVTLASSDQKIIKCHRILLSAGSGYLERILDQNPSNHPTVVLSQIQHNELKHLVEFMYSGEVAVEQESLPKLLEAANVLQIKGLYEAPAEEDSISNDDNSSNNKNKPEIQERKLPIEVPSLIQSGQDILANNSKRKKRKSNSSIDVNPGEKKTAAKKVKSEDGITPPESPNMYSPLFGISNAYFLSNGQNTNSQGNSNSEDNSPSKLVKDIPNLLSATQHPLSPSLLPNFPSFMNTNKSSNSPLGNSESENSLKSDQLCNINSLLMANAPVRRYKQYTEDTLQQALKEIMNGQSINRSSMKYNIPARTLRDWMKRLNIKSVFTHHSQKDGRSLSADSSEYSLLSGESNPGNPNEELTNEEIVPKEELEEDVEKSPDDSESKVNGVAFPGMKFPPRNGSIEDHHSTTEEEEEEIDDDEESTLQISS